MSSPGASVHQVVLAITVAGVFLYAVLQL